MSFYISLIISVSILLIGVLSIYIITGLTGMFSLGQASYMAVGAYTAGILAKNFNMGFILCAILAVVVGSVIG